MKPGVFPFFHWAVLVGVKIDFILLIYISRVQKLRLLWLSLLLDNSLHLIYIFIPPALSHVLGTYVMLNYNDLLLLILYSSVINTGLLLVVVDRNVFINLMFPYMIYMFLVLIILIKAYGDSIEFIIILLIAIPCFLLTSSKFLIAIGVSIKIVLLVFVSEVTTLYLYLNLHPRVYLIGENDLWNILTYIVIVFVILIGRNLVTVILLH